MVARRPSPRRLVDMDSKSMRKRAMEDRLLRTKENLKEAKKVG